MHRPIESAMTALALSGALLVGACGKPAAPPPPPPTVGVVVLKTEPVTLTADLPGRISAVETSEIRPQVSGVVRRRLFEEGSLVRAGQLLYEIEDAPYRAALGTAQGNLANAQAVIDSTRLQAQRYRELVAINAVSRQESDNATASARQATASVSSQRSAVQAAQVNLGFTRVRAPISGRIGRSLFTAGTLVQAGQADPLATIQRFDHVYVDLTQSAAQLLDLRAAMTGGDVTRPGPDTARVRLILPNGTLYPIEGKLQFSEVSVEPTTGAVTLRATFANPGGVLLPGMYVRATLVEGVRKQALMVPQEGITRNNRGNATALVVNAQNKVEQRDVATDRAIGNRWIVTSGLKPGDRLIVEGLLNLQPGSLVRPVVPQQVTRRPAGSPVPGAPSAAGTGRSPAATPGASGSGSGSGSAARTGG